MNKITHLSVYKIEKYNELSEVNQNFWSMTYGFGTKNPVWCCEFLATWLNCEIKNLSKLNKTNLKSNDYTIVENIIVCAEKSPKIFLNLILPIIVNLSKDFSQESYDEDMLDNDSIWNIFQSQTEYADINEIF